MSEHLLRRISEAGCKHIFGIAGDFILDLLSQIEEFKDVEFIGTCGEEGAGFAADCYARCNGLGVCLATYNVGTFKLINSCANSWAEMSPLLIISGAPGARERSSNQLLHHAAGPYELQERIFNEICIAAFNLSDASTAAGLIDRAITLCTSHSKPVYLELPRDMIRVPVDNVAEGTLKVPLPISSNEDNVFKAVCFVKEQLQACQGKATAMPRSCCILAGIEVHRLHCTEEVKETSRLLQDCPIATTILSKSAVSDDEFSSIGVYEGSCGNPLTASIVEKATLVLMAGVVICDINFNLCGANLLDTHLTTATAASASANTKTTDTAGKEDGRLLVIAAGNKVKVGEREFPDVSLKSFLSTLNADLARNSKQHAWKNKNEKEGEGEGEGEESLDAAAARIVHKKWIEAVRAAPAAKAAVAAEVAVAVREHGDGGGDVVDIDRLVQLVEAAIKLSSSSSSSSRKEHLIIVDTGDSLFSTIDMHITRRGSYMSNAFYLSMGFAVPGAIGAMIARPRERVVCFVGDGAFQMTGHEISSILRYSCYGQPPVIILLNNGGYETERPMRDGAFNNIAPWSYSQLPFAYAADSTAKIFSRRLETMDAVAEAVTACICAKTDHVCFLEVILDKHRHSRTLSRITQVMREHV
jgi:indolepyruvate decarboxylase